MAVGTARHGDRHDGALCDAAGRAAFRRVHLVHVTCRGEDVVAEASGILHRYPHTVPVSMATAKRLVAAGAPLRVDRIVSGRGN